MMTTATIEKTGLMGQAATMYALDALDSSLRGALTEAATFRKPALTEDNTDADWAARHAALDVVTVRRAGTVIASNGFMMHEVRLAPTTVAPLLLGDEGEATYWVHGTHIVRAPIASINYTTVNEPVVQGRALPYRVTIHTDPATDDCRMFMDWLCDMGFNDQALVLRGSLDKEGEAFAGAAKLSELPGMGRTARTWEVSSFPWVTDAPEPRPWLVVVKADWLSRLVAVQRGYGPIEIRLPALPPSGEQEGRAEEAVIFVRGTHSTGVVMPMVSPRRDVALMERDQVEEGAEE